MMPADALTTLAGFDAIYLGAVGSPGVPDHLTLWGLLLPIRQRFDLYLNLRPIKLLPGVTSPLAGRGPADIDMVCVRENTEGEYGGIGGRLHVGLGHEVGVQVDVFTRLGVERVVRHGFELARSRRGKLVEHHQVKRQPAPLRDVGRDRARGARRLRRRRARERAGRRRLRLPRVPAAAVRRAGGLQPVRRHHHRHRRRHPGRHGPGRERQHRPRCPRRACSSRCMARRPTSPGWVAPIPSARSGPAR